MMATSTSSADGSPRSWWRRDEHRAHDARGVAFIEVAPSARRAEGPSRDATEYGPQPTGDAARREALRPFAENQVEADVEVEFVERVAQPSSP